MAEYVNRQEAIDALQAPEMFGITPYHIELIKRIPTADVVPVVRCKDCIKCGFCGADTNLGVMGYYGFCSRGRRRDAK